MQYPLDLEKWDQRCRLKRSIRGEGNEGPIVTGRISRTLGGKIHLQNLFVHCWLVTKLTSSLIPDYHLIYINLLHHFGIRAQRLSFSSINMPPRREGGIGQGIPVANAVMLDEIRNPRTRMETIETAQRIAPDEGDVSALRKKKRMKVKMPKLSRYWPKQVEYQRWKYLYMTGISM